MLCPGLRITFTNEATGEKDEWFYTGDLGAYLMEELADNERLPARAHHRLARGRDRRGELRAGVGAECGNRGR